MTSFLGTIDAYSYSKQGTEVICRSDLTTRSEKPGSNPDLHSADLQTLPPPDKNNHHHFMRRKVGIIWREGLAFVNRRFCRRNSKVKMWALVGQCPVSGIRPYTRSGTLTVSKSVKITCYQNVPQPAPEAVTWHTSLPISRAEMPLVPGESFLSRLPRVSIVPGNTILWPSAHVCMGPIGSDEQSILYNNICIPCHGIINPSAVRLRCLEKDCGSVSTMLTLHM